jgi:hypothetical protein
MLRSKIRVKALPDVFRSTSAESKAMQAQIARVSVLYEDLRIEWEGAQQDEIKPLDRASVNTRRFYFVRRSLATFTELEQAFHKLNDNKEFQRVVKASMSKDERKAWDAAIKFFAKEHVFLKEWRNDLGGHFADAAAVHAIETVAAVGSIELYRTGKGADVKMPFAYELVAAALVKNKGTATNEDFLNRAFTFLKDAMSHVVDAVQILTNTYLFDRFK